MKLISSTALLLSSTGIAVAQSSPQSIFACGGVFKTAIAPQIRVPEVQTHSSLSANDGSQPSGRAKVCQPSDRELEKLSIDANADKDGGALHMPPKQSIATKSQIQGASK